ncbi:MAG: 2-deoxy-scyllo-inosamine dehydrogenase [bacterium ADurb.Bin374]|nr:MAG: 2-deoxy-scyllo-inosamine dehydrogenase [bacterium ADurb.Bin374]
MRALLIDKDRIHLVGDRQEPQRPEGWALIKPRLVGICGTDLELLRGYRQFSGVPGHEFVGEVVEADSPLLLGKRVVGEINIGCTTCQSSMNIVPMKLPTPREPLCSMNHTKPVSSRQTSMKWLPVPSVPRCWMWLVFSSFG